MLGLVGQVTMSPLLVTIFEATARYFSGTGSSALIALAALFYPTAIRSTGLGWAMSLGRLGSFVGPLVVGVLVSRGWRNASIYAALGAVAICPALCISAIRRETSSRPERLEIIRPPSESVLEGPMGHRRGPPSKSSSSGRNPQCSSVNAKPRPTQS
jgi:MFS family permease